MKHILKGMIINFTGNALKKALIFSKKVWRKYGDGRLDL